MAYRQRPKADRIPRKNAIQHTFTITGLPRCRLAWLSVLMTHGHAFCLHEGLKWGGLGAFAHRPETHLGDASPSWALAGQGDVVVRRPPNKVIESMLRLTELRDWVGSETIEQSVIECDEGAERAVEAGALEVDFADLGNAETLRHIWERCAGEGFDPERAELLGRLNIQTKVDDDVRTIRAAEVRFDE